MLKIYWSQVGGLEDKKEPCWMRLIFDNLHRLKLWAGFLPISSSISFDQHFPELPRRTFGCKYSDDKSLIR
jgi:hypothetical protein